MGLGGGGGGGSGGWRTLSECMVQSSHRFGFAASSPNLTEASLAGWAAVLVFAALSLVPFGLAAHPPNWIQQLTQPNWIHTGSSRRTKSVGLIESGSPGSAPNSGAASPQKCSWGLRPQTRLRLRPKPPSGGGLRRSPKQHSCGKVARGFGAELQPPRPPAPSGYATDGLS